MEEIWKDIKDFEGLYQVSNKGQVRSLDRIINCPLNGQRIIKGKILKPHLGKNGYFTVALCKNGKQITKYLHRVISESFIPNPDNKPCIDHINTIRTDNRIENLRWCTTKENMNNLSTIENCAKTQKGKTQTVNTIEKRVSKLRGKPRPQNVKDAIKNALSKPIYQYTKEGIFIKEYTSITEAKKETGISSIMDNLRNRQRTAGGFIWKYKEVA